MNRAYSYVIRRGQVYLRGNSAEYWRKSPSGNSPLPHSREKPQYDFRRKACSRIMAVDPYFRRSIHIGDDKTSLPMKPEIVYELSPVKRIPLCGKITQMHWRGGCYDRRNFRLNPKISGKIQFFPIRPEFVLPWSEERRALKHWITDIRWMMRHRFRTFPMVIDPNRLFL